MKKLLLCVLAAGMLFMSCTPSSGSNNQTDKTSNENEPVTQEPTTAPASDSEPEPESASVDEPSVVSTRVKVYDTFPYPGDYASVTNGFDARINVTPNTFSLIGHVGEEPVTYLISQVIEVPSDTDWCEFMDSTPENNKHYFISLLLDNNQYYAAVSKSVVEENRFLYFYLKYVNDFKDVTPVCRSYVEPSTLEGHSPRSVLFDLDATICFMN